MIEIELDLATIDVMEIALVRDFAAAVSANDFFVFAWAPNVVD